MNILLLRGFNNYFNRIVKKYTALADYKSHSASYLDFTGINFNPNDGVATELIIGSATQLENNKALSWDSLGTPDYLVCYETSNNTSTIKSRWFVLESERSRDGQYRIALKRDVLAEHFNEIMSAPCFVEKGYINNVSDPLLFNPEGGTYNQIKKGETLLKDATNCAWLVGYMKKNAVLAAWSASMDSDLSMYTDFDSISWKDGITLLAADGTTVIANSRVPVVDQQEKHFYFTIYNSYWTYKWGRYQGITNRSGILSYESSGTNADYEGTTSSTMSSYRHGWNDVNDDWIPTQNSMNNIIANTGTGWNAYSSMVNTCNNAIVSANNLLATSDNVESYNGLVVKKNNILYQLSVVKSSVPYEYSQQFNYSGSTAGDQAVRNFFDTLAANDDKLEINTDYLNNNKMKFSFSTYYYTVIGREYTPTNALTMRIPSASDRNGCNDELFDMFCIPYSNTSINFTDSGGTLRALDNEASMFAATQIMTKLGTSNPGTSSGGKAYDLQLLPYCPLELSSLSVYGLNSRSYYEIKDGNNVPHTFILFPTEANFTKNITIRRTIPSTPLALKIKNECDFCRLTSPNFNGMFEFKTSKLNGGLHYVNVDCTYKPYSPYVKLNPDFSGLYGTDFNDAVGLMLGGDFSLSTLSDAWINYELNNKNYQAIFNRQVQNLDVNNEIAREQLQFNNTVGILTGTIGGGVGGALTGAKAGPYGAIAGAAIGTIGGGIMAGVGGALNQGWLDRQQAEAKNYTIDMYNYQLGNIKALPQSITKTNPLTYNNKLWPILEEFSCTDTEKTILENKIKYNGMTVMAIGALNNYSAASDSEIVYLKGQLIRCENINDDFHIVDAIYQEVNKGFYIVQ